MRSFAYALMAVAATAGCGDETVPPPSAAEAERDPILDPDGGGTGGAGGAAGAGGLGWGWAGPWCETSALCPSCPDLDALCTSDTDCALGEVCRSTGCELCDSGVCVEVSRCFVAGGGACATNDDCRAPYVCEQRMPVPRCLRTDGYCDDSNDCIAGFACEDNGDNKECVDRRVPCTSGSDCPHGYRCFQIPPDQSFCRRISRPCADDLDCLLIGVPCGDADEDGRKECMPSLTPNDPDAASCDKTQCAGAAGPVCETSAEGTRAVCGQFGLCDSAEDCDADFECRDLWGDGRKECVRPLGCADSSECDLRNVCASSRGGDSPACVGGAAM